MNIQAGTEVRIVAENEITVGTEGAYLDITKDTAALAASNVIIN